MIRIFSIDTQSLRITTTSLLLLSLPVGADDKINISESQQKTRVCTCEDATAQSKYWCEERAIVTVVSFAMEYENAKKNVVEACEGIKSSDVPYSFDDKTNKKQ